MIETIDMIIMTTRARRARHAVFVATDATRHSNVTVFDVVTALRAVPVADSPAGSLAVR